MRWSRKHPSSREGPSVWDTISGSVQYGFADTPSDSIPKESTRFDVLRLPLHWGSLGLAPTFPFVAPDERHFSIDVQGSDECLNDLEPPNTAIGEISIRWRLHFPFVQHVLWLLLRARFRITRLFWSTGWSGRQWWQGDLAGRRAISPISSYGIHERHFEDVKRLVMSEGRERRFMSFVHSSDPKSTKLSWD